MTADSRLLYLCGLGVWVGEFNDEQIEKGIDKKYIDLIKQKTGLEYINTKVARGDNKEKVLRIWLCKKEDLKK